MLDDGDGAGDGGAVVPQRGVEGAARQVLQQIGEAQVVGAALELRAQRLRLGGDVREGAAVQRQRRAHGAEQIPRLGEQVGAELHAPRGPQGLLGQLVREAAEVLIDGVEGGGGRGGRGGHGGRERWCHGPHIGGGPARAQLGAGAGSEPRVPRVPHGPARGRSGGCAGSWVGLRRVSQGRTRR